VAFCLRTETVEVFVKVQKGRTITSIYADREWTQLCVYDDDHSDDYGRRSGVFSGKYCGYLRWSEVLDDLS
jgi:hypothetical protein